MPRMEARHILLATLGGQPQVVTFTLDLLLQRNFPIQEVIVLHPSTSDPRLQHALSCLNAQFLSDHYHYAGRDYPCHFRSHVVRFKDEPLDDITDIVSANATLDTIHYLLRDLKQQDRSVHLSVTGGRRLMSLLAISSALLHFRQGIDHVWHIYTPQELQVLAKDGQLMHTPVETDVQLIEVPYAPWGQYFPNLPISPQEPAQAVLHAQIQEKDAEKHQYCRGVIAQLTGRQHDVLRAFASGLSPQEVADELNISIKTVDAHKTKILEICREIWLVPEDKRLGYNFLYREFADHFSK